ncbi:MAG: NAD-dependent succinate-semialdehyde dehydrogenase [Steroidobacteraceae bacterium]
MDQSAGRLPEYPKGELYINGQWTDAPNRAEVVNPATEEVIGTVPLVSERELDSALEAASVGFGIWSKTAPAQRSEIMLAAARLLRSRIDEIAHSITLEHGKPFQQARLEVIRGCEFFEWDAAEGQRAYGRIIPSMPGIRYLVLRQPIGSVAAFSPWNFPLSQPARKIGGAIAAGCSVIIKPAEETPAGALHIARAFHEVGLPPGVLNMVFGAPAQISNRLISDDRIRLVAFTGSTAVGKQLSELAARNMKPVLMELGGHAPVIVCDDVDPVRAGADCAIRKARNAGQVCTSPTRFYVHEKVFNDFVHSFVETAGKVVVGNGLDPSTQMGPVANRRRLVAVESLVEDARRQGACVATGGERLKRRGFFYPVTALVDVPRTARVMREEPFGPVAVINSIRSLDEGIEESNALPFGLAAYAFTHSARNVDILLDRVQAGNLSINTLEASVAETPFGGVKDSGYGREGGSEGLSNYTIVKNLSHYVRW